MRDDHEAREWLQDFLGQGQVKSGDVKRAAAVAGFSERTLQRARSNLRVRITSEGYPRITYWCPYTNTRVQAEVTSANRESGSATVVTICNDCEARF